MPHKKIHAAIKKHAPKAFQSSKEKFHFKYPKICLLALSIVFAYALFSNGEVSSFVSKLGSLNIYLCALIAGILFSFGFTSAFGIGLFFALPPSNLFLIAFIGGIGSVISDLVLFKTIKFSFKDEFNELKKNSIISKINLIVKNNKHVLLRHYLLYALAGFLLAVPLLPDEIGVTMLAGLTTIKPSFMVTISFIIHTLMIFSLLYFL